MPQHKRYRQPSAMPSKPTLLLVEDDPVQRRYLATLLEEDGYTVLTADSGAAALAIADQTPPGMVLSDVVMEGMDGYELAMRFKGDPRLRQIPFILHSNLVNEAKDRLLAEAIGVDALLDKSLDAGALLQQLRQLNRNEPSAADHDGFDELRFLRMRARVLSGKIGLQQQALESERLRADDSTRHLHTLTDALPDLISELDSDFRYLYVNRAYETWHGLKQQEIVGLTVEELLGETIYQRIHPYLEQARQGHQTDYEELFTFRNRGERYTWVRYIPNTDRQGKVTSIYVIASDVTDKKSVESQLQKTNSCYKLLLRLNTLITQAVSEQALLDDACRIICESGDYPLAWIGRANEDATYSVTPIAQAGFEQDYLEGLRISWADNEYGRGPTGRAIREATPQVVEDILNTPKFKPWREQALRHGYAASIALPLTIEGKTEAALNIYARQPFAFSGLDTELLVKIADELAFAIAALRRQQRQQRIEGELTFQRNLFEAVFRHIPDTMVITDTGHDIIACNSAISRDFGYSPEELLGNSPAMLYADHAEFQHQQQLRYQQAYAIRTPYTIDYRRKDGSHFQGETLSTAFFDNRQRVLGHITVIRDVSERLAMEHERGLLEMQLQQAQKMETVGQLTGGIAHDFNNILASILGYTELAQLAADRLADEGRMKRYLNEIQGAGERARDIISKLLAFSRTGDSEQKLIDLDVLVIETTSLLQPSLSSRIELSTTIATGLPQIKADPNQLHQVLMNLCINARDAMEGHGRIDIELAPCREYHGQCAACGETFTGDYVRLSVHDNGSGIPSDVLSRMFDPFFTTKEIGKGSGMGLSMVHGIVHEHGGHIQVTTSDGRQPGTPAGTTFTILLPLNQDTDTSNAPQHGHRPHIVLIDDEPFVVEFLQQLLEFNGYRVTGFTYSQQARHALLEERLPCDLVISDQVMPGLSGTGLAAELQQQRPELPLLLFSGKLAKLEQEQAEALGIRGFLRKPIDSTQLIPMVQEVLGASLRESENRA